jgi:catechol 2,3-dioxygenase-like lactoylglutathione lyase family enzyme
MSLDDLFGSSTVDPGLSHPVPVLRMFDVDATRRFYVDYLGCNLDWQEGEGDGPAFMQVSRGPVVLNLSSHHGDGTPGAVVLVFVTDVDALHAELHAKDYPFLNPGIEPHGAGREMVLLDPSSNQIRFFERPRRRASE